jgi:hypothetical protein
LDAEKRSIDFLAKFGSLRKHKINELDSLADKAVKIEDYERMLMDAVNELED